MTSTELQVRGPHELEGDDRKGVIEMLVTLESVGAATDTYLDLSGAPHMSYQRYEDFGRFLGRLDQRTRWYIGDWILWGEELFGEESAQAVEATTSDRYDLVQKVTGLPRDLLMQVTSVCKRVARERRRVELGFWIHREVAKLEPHQQEHYLQRAVDEKLSQYALRELIRAELHPAPDPDPEPSAHRSDEGPTLCERIENAARRAVAEWSVTDGGFYVPAEAGNAVLSALGMN